MSDVQLRTLLEGIEQQVRARPGSLGRVLRRHRRTQTSRRIAAVALALSIATAGLYEVVGSFRSVDRSGVLPASPVIDRSNVSGLRRVWSVQQPGVGSSSLATAKDIVLISSRDGDLYALDGRTGEVRWVGHTQGPASAPVIGHGYVYVQDDESLYAFDPACRTDGATCQPRWVAGTGGRAPAPMTSQAGMVFVTTERNLQAFGASCGGGTCAPLWTATERGGPVRYAPAVADGIVWDSSSEALSAFPAACPQDACTPLVQGVRPESAQFSSGPVIDDGVIYVGAADGTVYAISTACANGGRCDVLWTGRTRAAIVDTPVVENGVVFAGSNDGRLYAFPTSCGTSGARCEPLWVGRTGGPITTSAAVANGVVYVTSGDGNLYAFAETCGSNGTTCDPLLVTQVGALPQGPVVWANRVVFVASGDGTVAAFTVDGSRI